MKILFLILMSVSLIQVGLCQCGTKDTIPLNQELWYGNNEFLLQFKEKVDELAKGLPNKNQRTSQTYPSNEYLYNIPVKIWIYRDANGNNPHQLDLRNNPPPGVNNVKTVDENVALQLIEYVNKNFDFNGISIHFYLKCEVSFMNQPEFLDIGSESELDQMWTTNNDPKALNWHIVEDVSYSPAWGGIAAKPGKRLAMQSSAYVTFQDFVKVLVHEIGHNFNLGHTHGNSNETPNGDKPLCQQEVVSRTLTYINAGCSSNVNFKMCEMFGDGFCDTEASPRSLGALLTLNPITDPMFITESTCEWLGNERDKTANGGVEFNPPMYNYMSYVSNSCRKDFTPEQIGAMYSSIHSNFRYGLSPLFESNNISLVGNVLSGETELHAAEEITVAQTQPVNVYVNGEMSLFASAKVKLHEGFKAHSGSSFSAKIGPYSCDYSYRYSDFARTASGYRNPDFSILDEMIENAQREKNIQENLIESGSNSSLFPNPVENILQLNSPEGNFVIYDSKNVLLKKGRAALANTIIEVSDLTSGVYILKFIDASGNVSVLKFTKM